MSGAPQWSLLCPSCGNKRGVFSQWEPPTVPTWDCDCGAPGEMSHWVATEPIAMPRLSGFSRSESDFTPHWNRAFGTRVRSLEHMRALQDKHGTQDVGVTGRAEEKLVPRDIGRRFKRHRELREAINNGQTVFEPKMDDGRPSGVKIDISAQTEKD